MKKIFPSPDLVPAQPDTAAAAQEPASVEQPQHFRLVDFNQVRHFRGRAAARVEVDPSGEWLWMTAADVRNNMRDFGAHPELRKALQAYGDLA